MSDYEKISFNCDLELLKIIRGYVKANPGMNQTVAINKFIFDGINSERELANYKNLYENATLKILYILREIAKTRGEDFINSIDHEFANNLPDLKDMILNQGIDYVGN